MNVAGRLLGLVSLLRLASCVRGSPTELSPASETQNLWGSLSWRNMAGTSALWVSTSMLALDLDTSLSRITASRIGLPTHVFHRYKDLLWAWQCPRHW